MDAVKGIVLAGGHGTRLRPLTSVVSKQLLPIYDKPMVFYPLGTLMLAGIRDILLISTPVDLPLYRRLLGDGSAYGIQLSYAVQERPAGLAQALLIGRDFIGDSSVALVLGDNIYYGHGLTQILQDAVRSNDGATIFGYRVQDPHRYGIAMVDEAGRVESIEEKPAHPASNLAVTGLYIYDNSAVAKAAALRPSARQELEITGLNNAYVRENRLRLVELGRGIAWLDTGTPEALMEASAFVATIERRQGLKVGCLEEIAFHMGFVTADQLRLAADEYGVGAYASYLRRIADDGRKKPVRKVAL